LNGLGSSSFAFGGDVSHLTFAAPVHRNGLTREICGEIEACLARGVQRRL